MTKEVHEISFEKSLFDCSTDQKQEQQHKQTNQQKTHGSQSPACNLCSLVFETSQIQRV